MDNNKCERERLKDIVEKEARQEKEQTEDKIDLTATKNKKVFKGD